MFPCCALCYEKYICENGEIDKKRLENAAKEAARGDKKEIEAILDKPCRCACHKDGMQVMH